MRFIRKMLPLVSIAVLAAVIYDGWIFYSRWRSARDGQQAAAAEEARRDRESVELSGGTAFKIVNFYAVPQSIRRGERSKICFGVDGAKRVRIEPEIGDLHPALSYCFEVTPRKETQYKLTAEDGAGHTATASLAIKVVP